MNGEERKEEDREGEGETRWRCRGEERRQRARGAAGLLHERLREEIDVRV